MKQNISNKLLSAMLVACLLLFAGLADARRSHHQNSGNATGSQGASGQFDYYLLALSWSPEFCTTPAGHKPGKQQQCTSKLGFVVHGLWPQYNSNGYPHDCGKPAKVPAEVASIALNAEPPLPPGDTQLYSHEWSKHGTCSGLNMTEYFTAIKTSAEKVKIPDQLKQPSSQVTLDANAIADAFVAANPGLTADMLNIEADPKGDVSGVQVCFSKELNFQNCTGGHSLKGGTFLPVQ